MKNYLSLILIFSICLAYGQNKIKNVFKQDSIHHSTYVNKVIKNLDVMNLIYLTDYNFISNDTYIFWKEKDKLKSVLISNKKTRKKIIKKKLSLRKKQKEKLLCLFSSKKEYMYLNNYRNCEPNIYHRYPIKIDIFNNIYIIDSNCKGAIRKRESFSILFDIIDDNPSGGNK